MMPREIAEFEKVRVQARAYLCLLLNRSIPNYLPDPDLDTITRGLKNLKKESIKVDALYILNSKGIQISDILSKNPNIAGQEVKNDNKSSRAYYYRAAREKKCIITNPYPSSLTNDLTVTASYPVYDNNKKLHFVVCIDISLKHLLDFAHPTSMDGIFTWISRTSYSIFSLALFSIAFLLFFHGVKSLMLHCIAIEKLAIEEMFKSTILITLALAIFDLVKTIFEEEVLGHHKENSGDIHKTMIRFLGSIIIALSIEALMLVFKFALIGPEKIVYAIYLLGGVTFLLFGLSFYLKSTEKIRDDDKRC